MPAAECNEGDESKPRHVNVFRADGSCAAACVDVTRNVELTLQGYVLLRCRAREGGRAHHGQLCAAGTGRVPGGARRPAGGRARALRR